jgi:chaperone required for assembly of F1-ATPase
LVCDIINLDNLDDAFIVRCFRYQFPERLARLEKSLKQVEENKREPNKAKMKYRKATKRYKSKRVIISLDGQSIETPEQNKITYFRSHYKNLEKEFLKFLRSIQTDMSKAYDRTIFIENLSKTVSKEEIWNFFSKYIEQVHNE